METVHRWHKLDADKVKETIEHQANSLWAHFQWRISVGAKTIDPAVTEQERFKILLQKMGSAIEFTHMMQQEQYNIYSKARVREDIPSKGKSQFRLVYGAYKTGGTGPYKTFDVAAASFYRGGR